MAADSPPPITFAEVAGRGPDDPQVKVLGWPDDVVQQVIVEHGDDATAATFADLDLRTVEWNLERLLAHHLRHFPTDPASEARITEVASNHVEVLARAPEEVRDSWENDAVWSPPPVVIDQSLLHPSGDGLQIVDGRTRFGVLRGRMKDRLIVARRQEVWVGRRRNDS